MCIEQPVGQFCWTAQGPACCRKQFDLVQQGVEAAAAALRVERERSLLVRGVSTRVIRRFAFVATDPFATWFKTSIESLIQRAGNQMSLSTLLTPDNVQTPGLLMRLSSAIPDDLD